MGNIQGIKDVGVGALPMRIEEWLVKKLIGRGDPEKVRVMGGDGAQELTGTAERGRNEEHTEAGCGEMFFKSAGASVLSVGSKFVMKGSSALGAAVQFQKEAESEEFFTKLPVAVGTEWKAILVERLPDRVILRDPGEELEVGIVAGSAEEFDVDGINQEQVGKGGVAELKRLFSARENARIARVSAECFCGSGTDIVEGNFRHQHTCRIASREIGCLEEFPEAEVRAADGSAGEELTDLRSG